jgi:hypothetical protein|tara:strand:- start:52 stop:372 length:321 start_codon:yes stop_codon:yes gene_type:complete
MANNFSDAQVAISNNSLTDIFTASNKSLVIAGTMSNTGGTSINVTLKKYDNSATTGFTILNTIPLPSGSSLEIPKIVLQTSDKIQAQSDNSSGNLTVALQLLTQVS